MRSRGRHGTQKTAGSYDMEWSLAACDDILEALVRGTYATELELDESDFTSLAITSSVITLGSGSPITLGLRVGDVIRLTNMTQSANNDRNLRITALTSTTITVAETLTNETADTGCEITRVGRKLINPAAGSLTSKYFTIEEYELDIDGAEIFTDCVWSAGTWSMQPNGIITFAPSWVGTGEFEALQDSSAPIFTSPTTPTGLPMSVVDATIRIGTEDVVDLTSFDVAIDLGATTPDVFGSGSIKYGPDVFKGQMGVSLNFTALRSDLQRVLDFQDETQLSVHVLAVDNESEPKDFLSIYVPNFTLASVDKSALSKEGGPRTQSIQVPMDLVGKDDRGGEYDPCMIKFQISNDS
jgi:hypothetical protein